MVTFKPAVLMSMVSSLRKERDKVKLARDEEISNINKEISSILKLAQENCPHEETNKSVDFDYHHRVQWNVYTCKLCEKEWRE